MHSDQDAPIRAGKRLHKIIPLHLPASQTLIIRFSLLVYGFMVSLQEMKQKPMRGCRVDALQRRASLDEWFLSKQKHAQLADSLTHLLNIWSVWYSGSHWCQFILLFILLLSRSFTISWPFALCNMCITSDIWHLMSYKCVLELYYNLCEDRVEF